jgi:hypothetical protein
VTQDIIIIIAIIILIIIAIIHDHAPILALLRIRVSARRSPPSYKPCPRMDTTNVSIVDTGVWQIMHHIDIVVVIIIIIMIMGLTPGSEILQSPHLGPFVFFFTY